jgi:hypothetical protein
VSFWLFLRYWLYDAHTVRTGHLLSAR